MKTSAILWNILLKVLQNKCQVSILVKVVSFSIFILETYTLPPKYLELLLSDGV